MRFLLPLIPFSTANRVSDEIPTISYQSLILPIILLIDKRLS
jgi:hypothetical protein